MCRPLAAHGWRARARPLDSCPRSGAALAGSFKGRLGSPPLARGDWLQLGRHWLDRCREGEPAARARPVAPAAGVRVAPECGWLGVRGPEIPGEVGERPTPNRTHRPAVGGARASWGGAFMCARECVYVCRALGRCASFQCPGTSSPSFSTPSSVPLPSLPPSRGPTAASRGKAQGSRGWGRAGSHETKGPGGQPAMASQSWGAWEGAAAGAASSRRA